MNSFPAAVLWPTPTCAARFGCDRTSASPPPCNTSAGISLSSLPRGNRMCLPPFSCRSGPRDFRGRLRQINLGRGLCPFAKSAWVVDPSDDCTFVFRRYCDGSSSLRNIRVLRKFLIDRMICGCKVSLIGDSFFPERVSWIIGGCCIVCEKTAERSIDRPRCHSKYGEA